MSAKVENTLNQLKVLFLCGLSVMLIYAGRVVIKDAEINVGKAVSGMAILILVSLVSLKIKEILPLKIPAFAWASLISLLLTTPWCPIQELVLDLIGQIVTSDISDAIMAIAGISIGCKLGDIKKLSWKMVLVALVVFCGTFFGSAIISHVVLSIQGII